MRGETARLPGGFAPVDPHQEGNALPGPPLPRRSGSETRKRCALLAVRLTPQERATIEEHAQRAGLATGSYARRVLLGAPPPRQARRPPIERELVARLLGELGKIGSNVNQIARTLNGGGEADLPELTRSLELLEALRAAALSALGRQP